ncbi:MAG: hypothetical protein R3C59_27340 [Planctomycetaceae bacterium]
MSSTTAAIKTSRRSLIVPVATLAAGFCFCVLAALGSGWLVSSLISSISLGLASILCGLAGIQLVLLMAITVFILEFKTLNPDLQNNDSEDDSDEDYGDLAEEIAERVIDRFVEVSLADSRRHSRKKSAGAHRR